jgi:hypothetical protein
MTIMTDDNLLKKFDTLDGDWRDAVKGKVSQDLKLMLAQVAKDEEENLHAKVEDQDLLLAKEKLEELGYDYKAATKVNKLKVKFLLWTLRNRGE